MADNFTFTPGSGKTAAADDIGGVLYPRVKNTWGADGVANDTSAANPMPVVQTGALPAGTNLLGAVTFRPDTANGLTAYRNLDLGSTGAVIKASPGLLWAFQVNNSSGGIRYLKFYNKATAPTNLDTPVLTYRLNFISTIIDFPIGVNFSSGISVRATTGLADNDNVSPGTNEVILLGFYS